MIFRLRGVTLVALFLLVGFFVITPYSYAAATKTKTPKGPKAFFPEREFDAGEILEGKPLTHTFTVINKGDEELKIIKVRPG